VSGVAPDRPSRAGILALRFGIIACLLLLLLGFVSIVWTPWPIASLDVAAAMQGPGAAHWLGTDQLGRDVLSLLMKGILTSFVVAGIAVAIGAVAGLPLGLAAAAWGSPLDRVIAALAEYFTAAPALVLAALLATLFGSSAATVMIAVGVTGIPAFAATARDAARAAGRLGYVDAARLAGSAGWEPIRRHALVDLSRLVLWRALSLMATAVLAEAALSYVGLGAQPPATSLGLLLRDAQAYAVLEPGLLLAPGAAVTLIVLALDVTAHGLRRTVVPALRREAADGDA
jgi:peptide/nickel transport system permease protein